MSLPQCMAGIGAVNIEHLLEGKFKKNAQFICTVDISTRILLPCLMMTGKFLIL